MPTDTARLGTGALEQIAGFIRSARPPSEARARAATAILDTVGVALAGAMEPAARAVQGVIADGGASGCRVWGTRQTAPAPDAALANGTAAHALDYDDMCFVSLAHPSAPLVPAVIATGELAGASGRAALDAYVVGFELQARLGRLMNPRHYQRGWHCTSTLGVLSAAAASARLLGLNAGGAAHAIGIAASTAAGLKENFGTMVKPLHAGLAARDGVLAAFLARAGMTASAQALDGPQGFLHAMDSESGDAAAAMSDLGARWEILETGITIKLYPSCAGTHPSLDALLDLRRRATLSADLVDTIEIDVDAITPTVLIYDRPASALEAKFSMPFCAAAAIAHGRVDIETFGDDRLQDAGLRALMSRVTMRVDEALGTAAPPLTQARVRIRLRDGRTLVQEANGARGYPGNPATAEDVDDKFRTCARRALPIDAAEHALDQLRVVEELDDVRALRLTASR